MENTNFVRISHNELETQNIAYAFADDLRNGDIVLLYGELGAGKTAFVKGVAKQKKVQEATSPTFTIINEYEGDSTIYHMDLYRIEKFEDLFETGFEEYLGSDGIVLIEWPDIAMPILKNYEYKKVQINKINNCEREIIFTSCPNKGI